MKKVKIKISRITNQVIQTLLEKMRKVGAKLGIQMPESLEDACQPVEDRLCFVVSDTSWYKSDTDIKVKDGLLSLNSPRLQPKIRKIRKTLAEFKARRLHPVCPSQRRAVRWLGETNLESAVTGEVLWTIFNKFMRINQCIPESNHLFVRARRRKVSKLLDDIHEVNFNLFVFRYNRINETTSIEPYVMTVTYDSKGIPQAAMPLYRDRGEPATMILERNYHKYERPSLDEFIKQLALEDQAIETERQMHFISHDYNHDEER